jgi:hypothetical protein
MQMLSFPQLHNICVPLFSNGTEIAEDICLMVSCVWVGEEVLSLCVHYYYTEEGEMLVYPWKGR